jgi:tight adherence protein B
VTVLIPLLVVLVFIAVASGVRRTSADMARARVHTAASSPRRELRLRGAWVPAVLAAAGFAVWRVVGAAIAVGAWGLARRLGRLRSRRAVAARRDEQLADAVGALTSAVRAGLSLPQALAYTAREAEPPFADDLDALVASLDGGVPMADAVTAWVEHVGTDDARLVGAVLELHRRSGGDLPAVLDQVAATIRERVAAAREVRALTAQARLSGLILGLLPIGFFAFLWLTSRREIEGALATTAGIASIAIGLVLEIGAFVWIRRLLEVA